MATMTLKDSEIKAILAEVSASLTAAKKSEVAKLSKAVEGEEPDGDEAPASSPEASDSAPAPEASEGAGGPPAGDVPPPAAPDASASPDASAAPASATMDGSAPQDPAAQGAEGPVDPQQLAQEYSALDDESLKAHYMACKQAVFARMEQSQGGAPGADAAAGAPPAGPEASAGGPPPAEGSMPPPAMKAEGKPEDGNVVPVTSIDQGTKETQQNNGPGADLSAKVDVPSPATAVNPGPGAPKADGGLGKSERESQLEAALETLAGMVLQTTIKPQRLATTSLQELERRELLAKGEKAVVVKPVESSDKKAVQAKLSELVREQKLSKSDKEKVMKYYVKGDFKLVEHLFPTK